MACDFTSHYDPQPDAQNVITVSRYYATQKGNSEYRKHVTRIVDEVTRRPYALVEYTGRPKISDPHGNS